MIIKMEDIKMMNKITKALAVSLVLTFPAAISRKLLLQNGWPVIRTS